MSDIPQNQPPFVSPPPPAGPPPQFDAAYRAPQSAGDTGVFLLIGAVGAFAMALVTGLQFARGGGQGLMYANAIVGLAGLIALGLGFLAFGKKTGIGAAKQAAMILFVSAGVALLPLLAVSMRSKELFKIVLYAAPIISAASWGLVGQTMLAAKSRLGDMAKIIGIVLLVCVLFDLTTFFLLLAKVRSRALGETLQVLMYVFTTARLLALIGIGTLFLQEKSKPA